MKKAKKNKKANKSICSQSMFDPKRDCYLKFDEMSYKYVYRESKQGAKFNIMHYLQVFLSLTSYVVIVHIGISLLIISNILSDNNIDTFGVLQPEDVIYSLANTNIRFSLVLSLLFLGVTSMMGLLYTIYESLKISNSKGSNRKVLFVIYFLLIAIIIYLLASFIHEIYRITYLLITLIAILILVFFMFYAYYKEPTKLISGLIVSFTVSFVIFYGCICYMPSNSISKIENQIEIELIDSSIIRSDSTRTLIFFGQKYVIFKNDSIGTEWVPVSQIKGVKHSKQIISGK